MINFQIPEVLKSSAASQGLSLTLVDAQAHTVCPLSGGA